MNAAKKTPQQRAEEKLKAAQNQADRLIKKVTTLKADLSAATAERDASIKRLRYVAQHPDLPEGLGTQVIAEYSVPAAAESKDDE